MDAAAIAATLRPGTIYWNGRDAIRQIVAVTNREVEFLDLVGSVASQSSAKCTRDDMRAWGPRPLPFQTAMSIRDILIAARARVTTRQHDFLMRHFPLKLDPYLSDPPASDVLAPGEDSMAQRLLERGIVAAVPVPNRAVRRIRLTPFRGLPLVRKLQGQSPLHDFLSR